MGHGGVGVIAFVAIGACAQAQDFQYRLDGDATDGVTFGDRAGVLRHGAGAASFFGTAIAATGDVDGDGVPDYVVGAYGGAYVYSGATGASVFTWEPLTEHFGAAVDGAGDVDGDGFCDVVVGVPLNSS